jgi:hypothetical protein
VLRGPNSESSSIQINFYTQLLIVASISYVKISKKPPFVGRNFMWHKAHIIIVISLRLKIYLIIFEVNRKVNTF